MQSSYTAAYNTLESVVLPIGTLYFWFISNHWLYFTLFGFVLSTLNIISCYFFVPESPRLLIEQQRFQEARISLQRIANFNGVKLNFNEADFIKLDAN